MQNIVIIKIDELHSLVLSQRDGGDPLTEINICGPEGMYVEDHKEISTTKELAEYILHYFQV